MILSCFGALHPEEPGLFHRTANIPVRLSADKDRLHLSLLLRLHKLLVACSF